jgi:hypothetical protein
MGGENALFAAGIKITSMILFKQDYSLAQEQHFVPLTGMF